MGICTSTGVIRDFAGPYFVSVSIFTCTITIEILGGRGIFKLESSSIEKLSHK